MEKRMWWAKLVRNFFDRPEIKLLRRQPGGDTICLICLQIQLVALDTNGVIHYQGFGANIEEELSAVIDTAPNYVKLAFAFLKRVNAAEEVEDGYLISLLPFGSENYSAERVRKYRAKKKCEVDNAKIQKALQCNVTPRYNVTPRTTTTDKETDIDKQQQEIEQIVVRFKVQSTVNTLLREGRSIDEVNDGLLLLNAAHNVKRPGAWLRRAVEEEWTDSAAERKEAERKENEAIAAAAREVMERERKEAEEEITTPEFVDALKRHVLTKEEI